MFHFVDVVISVLLSVSPSPLYRLSFSVFTFVYVPGQSGAVAGRDQSSTSESLSAEYVLLMFSPSKHII